MRATTAFRIRAARTTSFAAAVGLSLLCPALAVGQTDGGTLQTVAKQPFGQYLADAHGRAVYMFTSDHPGTSTCYKSCAEAWPPLQALGPPPAGNGVSAALLGTARRQDGSSQITYNGMPLYYFVGDHGPGTTAGAGVKGMGGEWYLVSPSGQKIDND